MDTYQQVDSEQVDSFLAEALTGNSPKWCFADDAAFINQFAERAGYHGVHGLLNDIIHASEQLQDWPDASKELIAAGAREAAMWELRHCDVLAKALAVMDANEIPYLIFKGTSLAYSVYSNPALRFRGDSDILVAHSDKSKVIELMLAEGCEYSGSPGDLVAAQGLLEFPCMSGGIQHIDLHWKISNSVLLSELFDFESLLDSSTELPVLSGKARRMDNVNAILLAVVHAHNHNYSPFNYADKRYYSGDRLIWLYDVHLLAGEMSGADWENLVALAKEKELGYLVNTYLKLCGQRLGTHVPEKVFSELNRCKPGRIEAYLQSSAIGRKWKNFLAQPSWKIRMIYFKQTFFPPVSVMLERYDTDQVFLLPWLYVKRATLAIYQRLPHKQKTD